MSLRAALNAGLPTRNALNIVSWCYARANVWIWVAKKLAEKTDVRVIAQMRIIYLILSQKTWDLLQLIDSLTFS